MGSGTVSRREARQAAMHILFAALSGGVAAAECADCTVSASGGGAGGVGGNLSVTNVLDSERQRQACADALAQNIARVFDLRRADIEQWMAESYQRPLAHMTMVERAIIAAAVCEMLGAPDTPRRVVINEAIEIAKEFGAEGGGALVNAVLDAVAKQLPQLP